MLCNIYQLQSLPLYVRFELAVTINVSKWMMVEESKTKTLNLGGPNIISSSSWPRRRRSRHFDAEWHGSKAGCGPEWFASIKLLSGLCFWLGRIDSFEMGRVWKLTESCRNWNHQPNLIHCDVQRPKGCYPRVESQRRDWICTATALALQTRKVGNPAELDQ